VAARRLAVTNEPMHYIPSEAESPRAVRLAPYGRELLVPHRRVP